MASFGPNDEVEYFPRPEAQITQLVPVPVTLYNSQMCYSSGKTLCQTDTVMLYGIRKGMLRAIHKYSAKRTLFKGHTQAALDLQCKKRAPPCSPLFASVCSAGSLLVWELIEHEDKSLDYKQMYHLVAHRDHFRRLCWHPTKNILWAANEHAVFEINLAEFPTTRSDDEYRECSGTDFRPSMPGVRLVCRCEDFTDLAVNADASLLAVAGTEKSSVALFAIPETPGNEYRRVSAWVPHTEGLFHVRFLGGTEAETAGLKHVLLTSDGSTTRLSLWDTEAAVNTQQTIQRPTLIQSLTIHPRAEPRSSPAASEVERYVLDVHPNAKYVVLGNQRNAVLMLITLTPAYPDADGRPTTGFQAISEFGIVEHIVSLDISPTPMDANDTSSLMVSTVQGSAIQFFVLPTTASAQTPAPKRDRDEVSVAGSNLTEAGSGRPNLASPTSEAAVAAAGVEAAAAAPSSPAPQSSNPTTPVQAEPTITERLQQLLLSQQSAQTTLARAPLPTPAATPVAPAPAVPTPTPVAPPAAAAVAEQRAEDVPPVQAAAAQAAPASVAALSSDVQQLGGLLEQMARGQSYQLQQACYAVTEIFKPVATALGAMDTRQSQLITAIAESSASQRRYYDEQITAFATDSGSHRAELARVLQVLAQQQLTQQQNLQGLQQQAMQTQQQQAALLQQLQNAQQQHEKKLESLMNNVATAMASALNQFRDEVRRDVGEGNSNLAQRLEEAVSKEMQEAVSKEMKEAVGAHLLPKMEGVTKTMFEQISTHLSSGIEEQRQLVAHALSTDVLGRLIQSAVSTPNGEASPTAQPQGQVQPPAAPVDPIAQAKALIKQEAANRNYATAFNLALRTQNVDVVVYLCSDVQEETREVFEMLKDNAVILLGLLEVLTTNLSHEFELKRQFIEEALYSINRDDPNTKTYGPSVAKAAEQRLVAFERSGTTTDREVLRKVKGLQMMTHSLQG